MSLEARMIEYTMTHRVGVGGATERYERPSPVLEMATRLRGWSHGKRETCQSCVSNTAVSVRGGMALCSRCREQRSMHLALAFDERGIAPAAVRQDNDHAGKQLRGHMIVFNSRSVDLGGFVEIIRPRAADRMEAEQPDLRALWSHDSSIVLGRSTAGTFRAKKVTRGVAIEIDPPKWAHGYVESVERRDVTGMSFGFWALEDDWHIKKTEDGDIEEIVREIFDMRVVEGSAVSWPAYPATDIKVVEGATRSAWAQERESADRLRLAR